MRIAYVSCAKLPEPDIDEIPLVTALKDAGHDPVVAPWDDDSVDWSNFGLTMIRATWNYAQHIEAFKAWIDRVDSLTTLINPKDTLVWNLNKRYLTELEEQGIPVIPTIFADIDEPRSISDISSNENWSKIVIKPTISAGSFATKSFDLDANENEAAQAFFDEMITQREMMIQRYMPSVDTVGETALIVINGELTHAIEKRPRFDDQDEEVYLRDEISDEMRSFASQVLKAADKECYYARVDIIPNDDGSMMLSELELLEPSLFFPHSPRAVEVFVQGLSTQIV